MYFVMYAFSNHAKVLHNVTLIDLPVQSAVLSGGVVHNDYGFHKLQWQTILIYIIFRFGLYC